MMKVFTERQWNSFPKDKKGHVTGDFNPKRLPGRLIGRRTLILGNHMLIEGVHFVVDESLV